MIAPRLRRLLLRVALPVTLLVLLYAVLGFTWVPHLIRANAQRFVSNNYHRPLTLGEVHFNPFTLRLDLRDMGLPDASGQPLLGFRHLMIDLTLASIWHWAADFEAILLEQPYARIVIEPDGTLNLSELELPASAEPKPAQPQQKPARLLIKHFSMVGGNIGFDDRAHPSDFRTEIKPISFELRDFSTVGRGGGTYSLSGVSEQGERFSWSGSMGTAPFASHGQFEVADLKARTISDYVRDSVQFELPAGTLSLHGEYDFSTATAPATVSLKVHDVTLSDLGIRPKGAAEDYIHLARLDIRETQADISKRTLTIGAIRLGGAQIHAWLPTGGRLNLLELVADNRNSPPPTTPASSQAASDSQLSATGPQTDGAPGSSAPPWVISAPDIVVESMQVAAEDRQVTPAATLQLDELAAHLTGFSTARTSAMAATLKSRINKVAQLEIKADLSPDLATVKGQADLANLDLTALQPYITQHTAMTLRSGLMSCRLNFERSAPSAIAVSGEAELTKVRTVDNALQKDFIKLGHAKFQGIDYHSQPASLRIHSILATAPYARVIIEADRTTNVSKVLNLKTASQPAGSTDPAASPTSGTATATAATGDVNQAVAAKPSAETSASATAPQTHAAARVRKHKPTTPTEAAHTPPPPGAGGLSLAIDTIQIEDGAVNYTDLWIQPSFAVGIQTLHGSIDGLSSDPKAHAHVELRGKVDRYAPAHIWGDINPLTATSFSDIKLSFEGMDLVSVTPYSGHFAGYKIEKGKMSVEVAYHIENRQLTAQHHMVIEQLELGERVESPAAVKLPLKLAVALLKDRNGVIDLNLPVSGSLDDPQFSLAPLIWKAVVHLLEKVATAPFALLGHLFGGGHGDEQLNYIDFSPGSAVLDEAAQQKLSTLASALKEKEKLELDIPISYSSDLDGPGLATAHLEHRLLALRDAQPGTHTSAKSKVPAPRQAAPTPAASSAGVGTTTTRGAADSSALESTAAASPPSGAAGASAPGNAAGSSAPSSAGGGDAARPGAMPPLVQKVDDPALSDPAQRFRLLLALWGKEQGKEQGKDTPLPESVQAVQAAQRSRSAAPELGQANKDLESVLIQKLPVTDAELESLGKHRALAIQDALLSAGSLDAKRVFIIGSQPKSQAEKDAAKDKVRVELALK